MGAQVPKPRAWQQWKQSGRMVLLAAFEDSSTGNRIKEYCQELSRDLGEECLIVEHVWLFNTFRLRELREIAAEEASASDLVIISMHQNHSLPEEVKGWINLWLRPTVRHPAALLALFDAEEEQSPSQIQAYLQKVAKQGSMEFLVEANGSPEGRWQSK